MHCQVDRLIHVPGVDKLVTCGRDGGFRVWASADLAHAKTVGGGGSWSSDVLHLPGAGRLVVADMSNALSFYDPARCMGGCGRLRSVGACLVWGSSV